MSWLPSSALTCAQGHRCDLVAAWPLPERDGRLICPRCASVLTADVPAQPDEREFRAYPRLPRKVLLLGLLAVPFIFLVIWLSVSRSRIVAVAAAPNGASLAVSSSSADGDGAVYLLNPAAGQRTDLVRGKRMSGPLAFTPDGHTLAIAVAEVESQPRPGERGLRIVGVIQLWDMASRRQRAVLRGHEARLTTLTFTSDGRALYSADTNGVIKCWDAVSGREKTSHKSALPFRRFAVSPDGRLAAMANTSDVVALVDTHHWRLTLRQGLLFTSGASAPAGLAFSPDGQYLALASVFDREVNLWNLSVEAAEPLKIPVAAGWLTCLAFSPDGRTLAVGSGSFGRRGKVQLFDVPSGRERLGLPVRTNTVTAVAFSADGETVIAGSGPPLSLLSRPRNGDMHRWSTETGLPLERGR
jgi:WD40 repeat protein